MASIHSRRLHTKCRCHSNICEGIYRGERSRRRYTCADHSEVKATSVRQEKHRICKKKKKKSAHFSVHECLNTLVPCGKRWHHPSCAAHYWIITLSLSLLYSHPCIHCKWSPLFTAAGPLTCSSRFLHRDKERNGLMPQLPRSRVCKVCQPPATAGGSPLHRSAWSHRRMQMSPAHTHTHTHTQRHDTGGHTHLRHTSTYMEIYTQCKVLVRSCVQNTPAAYMY